uniref:Calponin-homology (CH) domain-containing protein n=1 Tax=Denticeps clupeoides TaxID=299321 RepID=A0AAY4BZB8_9TELE
MSDILCRWLNLELRLSKFVEPGTISKDFANGYLIGEVLHRYELQEDFHQFSKSSSASSKLNNFTRLEPTLLLLGVPFGLSTAKSVMLGQHGAAARLLYQLYMVLQRKKRAGLTGTAMETMQPAAITRLNRLEQEIYRLKTVIRRGADAKLQKIVQRYEMKGRESYNKSIMVDFMEDQRQLKMKEEMRLQQIEKRRLVRRKQLEIMSRIHTAVVHIPKPPPNRTVKALERQRQNRRQLEAKNVHLEIAQFEKNRRKLSPRSGALPLRFVSFVLLHPHSITTEYIQEIRQRLEEDAVAREQREKRRLRVLMEQLQAHEAQEEALREEQLVERLTRQCHHEKKLVVQLMQVRQQKEVLRQNRIFRERQYQEQRQRDFQEALDTEEALLRQAKLEHAEEIQLEIELHKRLMVERAHSRYQKHFNICKEIINQIVDLATKAGEYRLLTGSLIPSKMMREWKELLFCGKPLYDRSSVELTSEQREKQEILNNQDYDEYMAMTGEWTWPADEDKKGPSPNNNILGHIVQRLQSIATPTKASTPPPSFPHFTIKACIVGKTFSGKTTCLMVCMVLILSKRALHGAAIDQLLRKGRAVTDELMVDVVVDAIRQVPADSGWILDGFPVNVTQAKLLEKALSGSDPDKTDKKKQNRTTLAMDPNPPKETASPSPSLDLVVLLEVSDDLVLGRAAEQGGEITGFQDTWPKLEKWFSGKQNLLVKVNAEAEEEVVFRNVEAILHKTMTAAEKVHMYSVPLPRDSSWKQKEIMQHIAEYSEQVAVSSPSTQIHNELSITETLIPGSVNWVYVDEPLPKEIAEYLVPYWENMCNSYVTNIKAVMQNLRDERNMIIHHLYNIREEFKQFLKQSDLKQQFVTQWQQDYNKFPDDMREDDETKAELHKRLDDLRERLWTICDQRRAEAEREQASLSENSWLENHTALLINHFSTLIQVEVDRFHDTLYLLRDYYSGMRGAVLPEMGHDFKCIPLLDTVDLEEGMKRIPLIPQRPSSAAVSKMTVACPSDEKLVYEIYEVAVATVNKMSGPKSIKSVPQDETMKVVNQIKWVFKECKKLEKSLHARLSAADRAVKMRLELIKLRVLSTVQNLQQRASQAFKDMEEWLGARFLAEMNSIDQLTEVVRHHIESAVKIQHELMLSGTEFYVDGDMKVVATPPPSPPRPLVEVPVGSTLTIRQLEAFHAQLLKVAPTGLMSVNEFLDILKGLTSIRLGTDALPDPWMHITVAQILELTLMLAQDSVTLDWCRFLLSAALPWPVPTKKQLLKVLSRFRMVDHDQTGLISEEQYLQTELWCPTESILPIPDDPSEPIVYDRLAHLRKFFFSVFANQASSPAHLDYVNMLLYLAAHPDSVQGFVRALSLMVGHPLCYESNSLLLKVTSKKIYEELGYGSEEKVPFSILSKHPRVQDLMESTLQYQLVVSISAV